MGFISGIKSEFARKSAEKHFPYILAQRPVWYWAELWLANKTFDFIQFGGKSQPLRKMLTLLDFGFFVRKNTNLQANHRHVPQEYFPCCQILPNAIYSKNQENKYFTHKMKNPLELRLAFYQASQGLTLKHEIVSVQPGPGCVCLLVCLVNCLLICLKNVRS